MRINPIWVWYTHHLNTSSEFLSPKCSTNLLPPLFRSNAPNSAVFAYLHKFKSFPWICLVIEEGERLCPISVTLLPVFSSHYEVSLILREKEPEKQFQPIWALQPMHHIQYLLLVLVKPQLSSSGWLEQNTQNSN